MKIEPIGYVFECEDYTMSIIKATPGEYSPYAVAVYTEAQMRQLGEACADACEDVGKWPSLQPRHCAESIRELIKEMLG